MKNIQHKVTPHKLAHYFSAKGYTVEYVEESDKTIRIVNFDNDVKDLIIKTNMSQFDIDDIIKRYAEIQKTSYSQILKDIIQKNTLDNMIPFLNASKDKSLIILEGLNGVGKTEIANKLKYYYGDKAKILKFPSINPSTQWNRLSSFQKFLFKYANSFFYLQDFWIKLRKVQTKHPGVRFFIIDRSFISTFVYSKANRKNNLSSKLTLKIIFFLGSKIFFRKFNSIFVFRFLCSVGEIHRRLKSRNELKDRLKYKTFNEVNETLTTLHQLNDCYDDAFIELEKYKNRKNKNITITRITNQ